MKRLVFTQHTVRCPLEDLTASVTVRTNPDGYPSRRHLDVAACSLRGSTSFVPPARHGYFSDVAPPIRYLCEAEPAPSHSLGVGCPKRCLAVLNAAEPGAAEPARCSSGVSDCVELARQVQSPTLTRILWFHGV